MLLGVGVEVPLLLLVKMVEQGQIIHIQITVHLLIMVLGVGVQAQSNVVVLEQQVELVQLMGIKELVVTVMQQRIRVVEEAVATMER
jgi:hypothetical protein